MNAFAFACFKPPQHQPSKHKDMDIILNGQAHGNVAAKMLSNGFDICSMRPYVGDDNRGYVTQNENGKAKAVLLQNSNATLRKQEWQFLDEAVVMAAKERLRIVADLRGAGLTYTVPNAMGHTVLQTQNVSDISAATVSMDPARQGESDRPEFDLTNLPLPVIHKDFSFSARQIATSRNMGTSIDVTAAQLAARRVAEEAEKLVIGNGSSITFGGGTIYGLTNFPNRITKSDLVAPTDGGWTPRICVSQVLNMRQLSINKFHFGPWVLYVSPSWDQYLDDDYSTLKGDLTLRQRIAQISGIRDVRTLDHLSDFQMVLVQQTTDVIREIIGMDITTVQWESNGGMTQNFKVMAIMVPQIRADFNGNTGLVHASVA